MNRQDIAGIKKLGIVQVEVLSAGWENDPVECQAENGKIYEIDEVTQFVHDQGDAEIPCRCMYIAHFGE